MSWSSGGSVSLRLTKRNKPVLTGLTLTAGGNNVALTPAFAGATESYTAKVPSGTTSLSVSATWTESGLAVTAGSNDQGSNNVYTSRAGNSISASGGSATVNLAPDDATDTYVGLSVLRGSGGASNVRGYVIVVSKIPAVTLSASPNPVNEGSPVTVTARLSSALSSNVNIPVRVTRGMAEAGDIGTLSSITINAGQTSGTGSISTNHDTDDQDETFTVSLGTLPSAVTAGSTTSVTVTIIDDEGIPTVKLSASPNPVNEGDSFAVTATLEGRAPPGVVRIPVIVRSGSSYGTAEIYDWGARDGTVLPSDGTRRYTIHIGDAHLRKFGIINIPTWRDIDTDDETLTVALDTANLPSGVEAGSPTSVGVMIRDLHEWPEVTLSLRAESDTVAEGSPVQLHVDLTEPLAQDVWIPLRVSWVTSESGDHGFLTGITIGAGSTRGSGTITTYRDDDSDDEMFSVAVVQSNLPSGVAPGWPNVVSVTITEGGSTQDSPTQDSPPPRQERGTLAERCAAHLPANAVRVSEVTGWRDDQNVCTSDGPGFCEAQVLRWNRVLKALGEDVGAGVSAMTVAESRTNESLFMRTRWSRVTATLEALETCLAAGQQPGQQQGAAVTPTVSISASPNPVAEGSDVRVTATLTSTLPYDANIPLVLTHAHGTAEDGDYGSLASITILAGFSSATGTVTTNQDADTDDETFTVALDTANLPSYVRTGDPSSTAVEVTITDDDTTAAQTTGTLLERCAAHLPANAVSVAQVRGWRDGHAHIAAHVQRWNRVLAALGEDVGAGVSAMTASEAEANVRRFSGSRWRPVAATLEAVETCLAGTGEQEQETETAATPEVSISAGNAVTEGESATFTVTASPAPAAALTVDVAVTQSGGYAAAGTRQVTVPTSGTATFTVATVDDAVDEPDGSVTATLAAGAGYTVSSSRGAATVAVADNDAAVAVPDIATPRLGTAREGPGAAIAFTVRLSEAATDAVSVDYATADGAAPWRGQPPARAGADYTAASGTLTFAPGETEKAVRVAILDDSIDEGGEYFLVRFSNPQGAALASGQRESVGLIRNADPLQAMWLARFGRMVASDAIASVTARLETPRDAGSHVTVAGQRMNFGEDEGGGGAALATVLTGFAQTFGAPGAPAADDDDPGSGAPGSGPGQAGAGPFVRHGLTNPWNDPAATSGARRVTGRELLLGTSFRAVLGQGGGSQWTSWGQGASVSHFSAAVPGLGLTGESATGSMGMDYERGRLLMGFAMTHSVGEGTGSDAHWRYALGSTATMALPYARLALSDRVSVWGLAGTGSGTLSLDLDGAVPQSYRTDLAMTLAATGVRGDLVTPAEAGGFALALKADAFWVRTESERVTASAFGSLMGARGESSRVRAVLDGSRTFSFASGAGLTPSLEFGVRHDAGDAESGTGLEIGGGLGYADPSRGLDMALRVHGLAVHAEEGYEEWGVSGQLRLVPGGAGRGLSASLTPSYGVDPSGSERLWALPASSGLAANGDAIPSSRLDAEVGYGMALWGDRFTGTPNVGFGLSETAREYRMGWRLTSAVAGDPGFEVSLDATRREAANDNDAEHGVMLRSLMRW